MIKFGTYLAEAIGGERYLWNVMDMGNAQGIIHVTLLVAQEKRLDWAACAVQREQSGKTYMRTSTDKACSSHVWFLSEQVETAVRLQIPLNLPLRFPIHLMRRLLHLRLATRIPSDSSSRLYQQYITVNQQRQVVHLSASFPSLVQGSMM